LHEQRRLRPGGAHQLVAGGFPPRAVPFRGELAHGPDHPLVELVRSGAPALVDLCGLYVVEAALLVLFAAPASAGSRSSASSGGTSRDERHHELLENPMLQRANRARATHR
jgi:hypothetical protein